MDCVFFIMKEAGNKTTAWLKTNHGSLAGKPGAGCFCYGNFYTTEEKNRRFPLLYKHFVKQIHCLSLSSLPIRTFINACPLSPECSFNYVSVQQHKIKDIP